MSAYPYLPLFTDAFIADTGHLTAQETGAYLMLLMVAWRQSDCVLPDDDAKLSRWARLDLRTWKRIKPSVMSFWTFEDGVWSQSRLTKERSSANKRAEVARNNGKHGGRPKPLKNMNGDNPAGYSRVTHEKATIPIGDNLKHVVPSPPERAQADQVDLKAEPMRTRIAVAGLYEKAGAIPPDTGRIAVWIERGYKPSEIEAVIADHLARGRKPATLKYFDGPLQEIRDVKQAPAKPEKIITEAAWRYHLESWRKSGGAWIYEVFGPAPGKPGCKVPAGLLAEFMNGSLPVKQGAA